MNRSLGAGIGLMVVLGAGSLAAHHSPVMFDHSKKVTLIGTVAEFSWTNPHSSIQLDVADTGGSVERWSIELGSPNSMVRNGWKSNIIKFGDSVTIVINPLRGGEHGGAFVSMTLPDGRVLGGRQTD